MSSSIKIFSCNKKKHCQIFIIFINYLVLNYKINYNFNQNKELYYQDLFENADISVIEHRTPVGRELEKLLKIPIDSYNDVLIVLNLDHFIPLLTFFDYRFVKLILVAQPLINGSISTDRFDLSL